MTDSAEILSSERSTPARPRDTSSSPDSSSVPSARTVTRYDLIAMTTGYSTDHEMERSVDGEWVPWADVSPLLTALAAQDDEKAALQKKLDYAKIDHERSAKALWAAVDVIKLYVGGFATWPEPFKDAFSWAMIAANQELTPEDITHAQELAKKHGWLTTERTTGENFAVDPVVQAPHSPDTRDTSLSPDDLEAKG